MYANLKLFFPLLNKYKWVFIYGAVALLFVDLLDVIPPWIIGYAIDSINNQASVPKNAILNALVFSGLAYVIVVTAQAFFRYFMRKYFHGSGYIVGRDLRNAFYCHVQKLPQSFFSKNRTGDLMARATADIDGASSFFSSAIFIGLDNVFYFITVPFIMLSLSPMLTLWVIIPPLFLPWFVNKMSTLIHDKYKESQETLSKMSACAQENFSGAKIVKSFAQEENQMEKFGEINETYRKQSMKLAKLQSFFGPSLQFAISISVLIVIVVGGKYVIDGKMTIGDYTMFQFYLLKIIHPMIGIGWTMAVFQRASASMQRLREIMDADPEIKDSPNAQDKADLDGDIVFRNVTVQYDEQCEPALNNINLRIKKGNTVAIVGPIGSGKSTLINLIARMADPHSGQVTINGRDVKDISLGHLRRSIGTVPQESFLFSASIRENIAYGVEATQEEIDKAADAAMVLKEVVSFPEGYDTMLGERGVNLSGGQRQRITIARAIIKNPRIILLDDCLSSVDSDTEEEILKNLDSYLHGRTCLIVTHRIPAVKIADEIIYMDHGAIIEHGSHESLMKQNSRYADFFRRQQLERDLERL